MIHPYPPEIEDQMRRFYQSLSEKERRRYAGIEAVKLGHGGISYIGEVLACNHRTVVHGMEELNDPKALEGEGIRQSGGGRKPALESVEGLDEAFFRVIDKHTAGSPMDETVKWTNLTRQQIADGLKEEGITVSVTVVDQLLERHNFRRRQAFKSVAGGQSEHRDEQFQNIERLQQEYKVKGNPILSMDTKKKN